jgi:superfamily II DNA or RNA helicase
MRHGPVLLIVPTVTLVRQMVEDWRGYGWADVDTYVHQITAEVRKETACPVVVSTWQSVYKLPAEWFARYQTLLGDEAHTFKANSLRAIMEKLPECKYRIGVTGTLDDAKSHRLMVEGVFGRPYRVAKTSDLQAQQHLTPIKIQGHVLSYPDRDRQQASETFRSYEKEIKFVIDHPKRLAWMADFVAQIPGNVLVLYQFVEAHGVPLHAAIQARVGHTRPVYFISGAVDASDRERIRALLEAPTHVVLAFGDDQVRCAPDEMVQLADGTEKPAKVVTTDDDVADDWILNRKDRRIPTKNSDG